MNSQQRSDISRFQNELMQEPPSHDDKRMYDLAMEYHVRAELYDRRICTVVRDGSAIPMTPQQHGLVNRNARKLRMEITQREGVSFEYLHEWIGIVGPEFEKKLKRGDRLDSM